MIINRFVPRALLVLLGCQLALPLCFAQPSAPATPAETAEAVTNTYRPVKPAAYDGRIAFTAANLLEASQYQHQRLNANLSSKFFDRYLEFWDPQRLHFTQGDLAEFEHYRTNLDRLTLNRSGADTTAACDIFNRFMERFQQHVAYVDDLLKHEKFCFDDEDRIVLNRKDSAFPKDLEGAKQLWRERLRAEYLQEKLGKKDPKKKTLSPHVVSPKAAQAEAKAPVPPAENDKKLAAKPKTEAEEIVDTLARRYQRNLRAFSELNDEDVLGYYLTTLAHVYDPHSDFMTHAQLESFSIQMNLSLFGIGAELRSEDGFCTINRLLPNGPAEKSSKIHENDRIVSVAQSNLPPVDLVDMRLDKAVQLIRGPKGTEVHLGIIPAGADASARFEITLVRDEIKLEDQEAKAKVIELPKATGGNLRLGVIDLPSFYAPFDPTNAREKSEPKSTSVDVGKLLTKMKQEHVSGVILDLRRNGGGSLEEAIRLAGLFIKEGPIVQVKNYNNAIEVDDDPDPTCLYDGPLVVLTSRQSASASEIVAGALQDYGRALIVGDTSTHGKGTVQTVVQLSPFVTRFTGNPPLTNDPGAMKITIKKFYRASGASTQLKGVVPDIVLPSVLGESKEIGESALENPLEYDTIKSASYEHLNFVAPYLPELRKRSSTRVATDPEYAYIRDDIELYKKYQADKTISLNEKQRLKQKAEDDARAEARKKERLARATPKEIVHELTVKQTSLPGLPPPVEKTNSVAGASIKDKTGTTVAVASTNASVATGLSPLHENMLDEALDEKAPFFDAALAEAEHILVDYVSLLPKDGLASASHSP